MKKTSHYFICLVILLVGIGCPLLQAQIVLPLEVLGPDGTTQSVSIQVSNPSQVTGLWMLINNLSYENKASVKINNGPWVQLNNTTVNVAEPAKSYGGIGGAHHVGSMKITLPLSPAQLVAGSNTVSFRFNQTDGISIGYRVVRFNLVDATGKKLLPSSNFMEEDPNTWTQPIAGKTAAAAGKVLWETKALKEGISGPIIRAKCGDCHAKNGRDLKYFNYSNHSIIERSIFHGLSETEGKQIASYIRSLDVPNPGRPWNPPYQPGPGLDSKPVNEWAAGAGIDWVLEKDEMVYPFLFPNGIDTSAISLSKTLNVRETPVMMQFPDWNHWLPTIHPYDALIGGDNFINSSANYLYNGEGSSTSYNYNLIQRIEAGPDHRLPWGPFYRSQEGLGNNLGTWKGALVYFVAPFSEDDVSPTGPVNWTKRHADEIYSFRLWHATKQWELINGNNLEGIGKLMDGPNAEDRSWPGAFRHVFDVSPHLAKIPRVDATSFNGKKINQIYLSNVWYHVQPVLNSGNTRGGGFGVVDWAYAHGNLNDLKKESTDKKATEPGRKLILMAKQMQQKHQNARGAGAEDPWYGWELLRDHDLLSLLDDDQGLVFENTDPALRRQLIETFLTVWYKKSVSYPVSQYKRGSDSYDVSQYDSWLFEMVEHARGKGVDCELLNKIADFGKALYGSANYNWESIKVSCPVIHYPKITITSPANGTSVNSSGFSMSASASIASGSISKVEFYHENVLLGTDLSAPYTFDFSNLGPGRYFIQAKAYDQTGNYASVDMRTVLVTERVAPTQTVTFTVKDANSVLVEGASVAFNGQTLISNTSGVATFTQVAQGSGLSYTVKKTGYNDASGTVSVAGNVAQNVVLAATTSPTYTVSFTVKDAANGPVSGASVVFKGQTIVSNANGVATFTSVAPGSNLSYSATKTGYINASGTVNVTADLAQNIVLMAVSSPTYIVSFTVKDANNALVSGASVSFNGQTGTTTETGQAVFANVAPGSNLPYNTTKTGFNNASGTVNVAADVAHNIVLTANSTPTYTVSFTIRDVSGKPMESASATFNGQTQTTTANGEAVFNTVIPSSNLSYNISKTGYNNATGTVNVTSSDVTQNVVLAATTSPTYTVSFTVKDAANGPVSGASVVFKGQTVASNANGLATFSNIASGSNLSYSISKTGFDPASGSLSVASSDIAQNVVLVASPVTVPNPELNPNAELVAQLNPRNIFSPNGDGVNESWEVEGIEQQPELRVLIFNMYGQQVFQAQPYTNSWDGLGLPEGIYYYQMQNQHGKAVKKGAITLVR